MKFKLLLVLSLLTSIRILASPINITTFGAPSTENFNTLATTGTANTIILVGWALTETGGGARDNEQYGADDGGSATGDTYSYGAVGNTERALGGLQSGTLIPVFGVNFSNGTGSTINSLLISYAGEQWRLGALGRIDQLDFQYSLNATDLATGTWTDFNPLDFVAPVSSGTVGALNGNVAPNRTLISSTISALSIPNGTTFWLRWTDLNATGSDDGLAIDDFSLTAQRLPESLPSGIVVMALFGFLVLSRRFSSRPNSI